MRQALATKMCRADMQVFLDCDSFHLDDFWLLSVDDKGTEFDYSGSLTVTIRYDNDYWD